jgi:hypothetical protein
MTWGKLPFEFAHFTDGQLTDAMLSIARTPHPHDRATLVSGLHMQRTRSKAPDIEKLVWRNSRIKKPSLADALSPPWFRKNVALLRPAYRQYLA